MSLSNKMSTLTLHALKSESSFATKLRFHGPVLNDLIAVKYKNSIEKIIFAPTEFLPTTATSGT